MRYPQLPRRLRLAARAALVLAVLLVAPILFQWSRGNPGTIVGGQLYRTAQLSPAQLDSRLQQDHIRSVVNLRGCNPDEPWYRQELATTLRHGATQIDISMASDQFLTRAQIRAIVDVLQHAQRPLLIHCEWGAERTGLVAAFATLLETGGTLDAARAQFSVTHLFLPTADGRTMAAHLDLYAAWLASEHFTHTPARFLDWATAAYRPPHPTREEWPYDPYPLAVVTQPGAGQPARDDAPSHPAP